MNTIDSPYFNIEKFARRVCEDNFPRAINLLKENISNYTAHEDVEKFDFKNQWKCEGVLNTDAFFLDSREIYD